MTERLIILVFRELSEYLRPCEMHRVEGDVVLFVDPWADRYDLLRYWRHNLDDFEMDRLREALQWPDGMVPTAWLEGVRADGGPGVHVAREGDERVAAAPTAPRPWGILRPGGMRWRERPRCPRSSRIEMVKRVGHGFLKFANYPDHGPARLRLDP